MPSQPTRPKLGEETVPPDEPQQIEQLIALHRSVQEAKDRAQRPVPRNVHPKQHGCTLAEFTVESDLPPELRHGIFAQQNRFSALVRFSNAKQHDDRLPDAHGMAIKLLDVPGQRVAPGAGSGTTQDFVLIDHPVFFARDVKDMLWMMQHYRRLMLGGVLQKSTSVVKAALSPDYRFRILRKIASKRPDNPLMLRYWSTTPFRLGPAAVKFSVTPQETVANGSAHASPDRLRIALTETLHARDAFFDFLVQLQTDAVEFPIEDAAQEWDETRSPFRKVATLRIPRQTFDSEEQMAWGEDLSFAPWHALAAHCPLGGINRARQRLYTEMAEHRQRWNGRSPVEPTGSDIARFQRNLR